jgi:hypothetical protein
MKPRMETNEHEWKKDQKDFNRSKSSEQRNGTYSLFKFPFLWFRLIDL